MSSHCSSRILLAVQNTPHSVSDRQESSIFLSQLLELLTATTSAINRLVLLYISDKAITHTHTHTHTYHAHTHTHSLLVNGSSVPHMRDMLGSLDVFLQTVHNQDLLCCENVLLRCCCYVMFFSSHQQSQTRVELII